MLFRVWNLGPIREAELDLSKDLIVLTGPNNTGKTYLTWAVYGLLPPLARVTREPISALQGWVDQLLAARSAGRSLSDIPLALSDFLDSVVQDFLRRLPDEFASHEDRFRETKAELRRPKVDVEDAPVAFEDGQFRVESLLLSMETLQKLPPEEERRSLSIIYWIFVAGAVLDISMVAFPVERLAINLFARELAANRTQLVDQLLESGGQQQDLLRRSAGRYPRAIRDALQRALKLHAAELSGFADLADELEREVLNGRLSKTEFDELEFTPGATSGAKPIGLHQSASVIKSLASLVWHLRYSAMPNQRLIIDEPELNLHPDNQRRVARVLAKAVNRGLKLMLSTHSDYFVRELNNLIMLSQDSDAARGLVKEMGIDPLSTIKPDRLGVYLVNDGKCTPVPVTETGFEVKTIDEEIHRLNRDSQTIYTRLFCE